MLGAIQVTQTRGLDRPERQEIEDMRQKTDQKEKRQKIRDKRKGAKPDRVYKLVLKQKS